MSRDNGGPAFPVKANNDGVGQYDSDGVTLQHTGLTLRDYFAAKALAAMIGNTDKDGCTRGANGVTILTRYAYEYADAMLAARAAQ